MRTFTFGFDHTHPLTGESLARHYIQVPGDGDQSREIMLAAFGQDWAMQYLSPEKLKNADKMTELVWTPELADRVRARIYSTEALRELDEFMRQLKTNKGIDEYFDLQKKLPEVTTITGTPVTEYALHMTSGAHQSLPDSFEVDQVYPIGKQIRHHMKFGGRVYKRRYLIVEDWTEVTEEEVDRLCAPYDDHVVDLSDPQNLVGKTLTVDVPKGPQLP